MNTFIKEFRENIPYIADQISASLCNRNIVETDDVFTYEVLEDNIEEFLKDWISEYQSDMNNLEEDTSEEFYNEQL